MRRHLYALCTDEELALVTKYAKVEGLSRANFIRFCINGYLVEQGDDVPMLPEKKAGGSKKRNNSSPVASLKRKG